MLRKGCLGLVVLLLLIGGLGFGYPWMSAGPNPKQQSVLIAKGSSLGSAAVQLEKAGVISSASAFRWRARLLGGGAIKAGEFDFPKGASERQVLSILQGNDVVQRFVTIPEGWPSIMVYDRIMATKGLTGTIDVPAEGSVLPDTYSFEKGATRQSIVDRMQRAMDKALAEAEAERSSSAYPKTRNEILALASIIEKETAKPSERRTVAGVYTNRLRVGMKLQADPTIIYPITKGKALGRRIRQSEIDAVNDYNTYSMVGLPIGPIANPGKESIKAALNPEKTDYIFFVADGTGGHVFARTNAEHEANVEKWKAIRRARGEM
jgi:UPF0755 protein